MNRPLSDETLRAAWHAAAAAYPEACPPAERIWDAAHGLLAPAELRQVLDHVGACAACAEAWRLAIEVGAASRQSVAATAPAMRPRRGAGRPWWIATAAAAVLVVGLGLGLRLWGPAPEPVYRADDSSAVHALVEDGATLPRDRFELRWEGPPEAVEYSLRLTTADLRLVVSRSGLSEPRYLVPAAALADFADGTRLYWQVRATVERGEAETSPTYAVEVAAASAPGGR